MLSNRSLEPAKALPSIWPASTSVPPISLPPGKTRPANLGLKLLVHGRNCRKLQVIPPSAATSCVTILPAYRFHPTCLPRLGSLPTRLLEKLSRQFPPRDLFGLPTSSLSFLALGTACENCKDFPSSLVRSHPQQHSPHSTNAAANRWTVTPSEITTMAQAREAAFNPSSPHSSSGGADSYKHEGTPDTRLTAFSPDGDSTKSNKLLTTLSLHATSDHPTRFHVNTVDGFGAVSAAAEKDPFISSTGLPKPEQKLSPTASSFRPVSVPVVARGSLGGLPGLNLGLTTSTQQFLSQYTAAKFSAELSISRHLVFYASTHPVSCSDVEDYFAV